MWCGYITSSTSGRSLGGILYLGSSQGLGNLLILFEVGDLDVLATGRGELWLVILKVVHFAYFNHSLLLGHIVVLTSGAL